MRRAILRINQRVKNLVDELHHQVAAKLCADYDTILLPTFDTSVMVRKDGKKRRIGRGTARSMLTFAHYRFRTFLLHKARETGTKVVLVNEAYTSQTCGGCGNLHNKLGGGKVFRCPSDGCEYVCDRDVNGARNILLRFMRFNCESTLVRAFGGADEGVESL